MLHLRLHALWLDLLKLVCRRLTHRLLMLYRLPLRDRLALIRCKLLIRNPTRRLL